MKQREEAPNTAMTIWPYEVGGTMEAYATTYLTEADIRREFHHQPNRRNDESPRTDCLHWQPEER